MAKNYSEANFDKVITKLTTKVYEFCLSTSKFIFGIFYLFA